MWQNLATQPRKKGCWPQLLQRTFFWEKRVLKSPSGKKKELKSPYLDHRSLHVTTCQYTYHTRIYNSGVEKNSSFLYELQPNLAKSSTSKRSACGSPPGANGKNEFVCSLSESFRSFVAAKFSFGCALSLVYERFLSQSDISRCNPEPSYRMYGPRSRLQLRGRIEEGLCFNFSHYFFFLAVLGRQSSFGRVIDY